MNRTALAAKEHKELKAKAAEDGTHSKMLARLRWVLALLLTVLFVAGCSHAQRASAPNLQVATFSCEVTPPPGHPLCGGWIKPLVSTNDPLLAKGIVLSDGRTRYVLCAVDWCLLQTGAYDLFRSRIARAAGVSERQVALHTVHQHNAPIADVNAQLLLEGTPSPPLHLDLQFMTNVTDRVAASVQTACGQLRPFTAVGYGKTKVERFASNRRVRLADGKIHSRSSFHTNAALHAAPEGLIDPWLRTVTFFDGDKPLVRLHYYGSHPQGFYGDGRATSDTVGLARLRLEREEGVPQIYFTGCEGNITPGKYNDGSPESRAALSDRIYTAMKQAAAATQTAPAKVLAWQTAGVEFAMQNEPEWSEAVLRKNLFNTNAAALVRLKAALNLAWHERCKLNPVVDIQSLVVGPVTLLHLPGEAFIEYQLYAQSLRPSDFIAVAACGEAGPGYICLDASLTQGGYEPTMSRAGPPSEFRLKAAIAKLLAPSVKVNPPFYPDKLHLLAWRDAQGREHPITRPSGWVKRRNHILASMQEVMGPLPRQAREPLEMKIVEETKGIEFTRLKITFAAERGDTVPAYLFIPSTVKGKAPAMLCLHQTTALGKAEPAGVGTKTNLHYARELAQRGYITLAPDYPNFGDYKLDVYQRGYASATMKGVLNHIRAIDLLQSLPQADAQRIGVIGHSLGGHNALFVAAFDERIKAVVSSCGFNSFFKYYGGNLAGWSHAGYMPRISAEYARDPKQMRFDFTEVLAAIAPRPVFINAPVQDANFEVSGVHDCLVAAKPVYQLFEAANKLSAVHPPCGHDFPPEVRDAAYDWLDTWLKNP